MIVQNGMCYAENRAPVLKIVEAKSRGGYELDVLFNNGDRRRFDGRKLLAGEVFAPLADESVFNEFKLDYETLTWLDGEVDVAPEFVYENSTPCGNGVLSLRR